MAYGQAWTELIEVAQKAVDKGDTPAAQLAVARHGELVLFETLGDAQDTTRFAAYSATKPIVASAVWTLMGEGKLDVSRPLHEYVPEFDRPGVDAVTVEQVLLHTCGFPSAPMHPEEGADPDRRRSRFATWRLQWEPGSKFEYHASSAHWVLVDLIERLGGRDFRDYIEERVCRPHGLPRLLGIPEDQQGDIAPPTGVRGGPSLADDPLLGALARPSAIAAGVPGGGGIMTAASLALFYQAVLNNDAGVWKPDVLNTVKTDIRCVFPDPMLGAPVNRTLGLVIAGDDGKHMLRYACFGAGNSPGAFGHAGAHGQVGWADPATGISFAYLHNGLDPDMRREGARAVGVSSKAADLIE
jgi:CubicO group peptidase (beta-lactamase class C family)